MAPGAGRLIDRRRLRIALAVEAVGSAAALLFRVFAGRPDRLLPLIGVAVGHHLVPLAGALGDRALAPGGLAVTKQCPVWSFPDATPSRPARNGLRI